MFKIFKRLRWNFSGDSTLKNKRVTYCFDKRVMFFFREITVFHQPTFAPKTSDPARRCESNTGDPYTGVREEKRPQRMKKHFFFFGESWWGTKASDLSLSIYHLSIYLYPTEYISNSTCDTTVNIVTNVWFCVIGIWMSHELTSLRVPASQAHF